MKIRTVILFLALVLIFTNQAECDDSDQVRQLFYKGDAYYKDGDFPQAIAQYEQALKFGLESGPLCYNLANAYFKNGSLGKAILNYARAQRLMPRDADLISNLAYARSLIKGGAAVAERAWLWRIFFFLADSFSLNTLTLACEILYLALAALIIIFILAKTFRKPVSYMVALVFALLVISASLFYVQYSKVVIQKEAVVVCEKSDSKFEPFAEATTFFTLYEGESVNVVTSEKDWVKIKRPDGKQGWIRATEIEFI